MSFLFDLFHAIKQINEEILCVIKQRPHNWKCNLYQKVLLLSIAIFQH